MYRSNTSLRYQYSSGCIGQTGEMGRPWSPQGLRHAQMLCSFIAAELDAAQRSEGDLGPPRGCAAPSCSAASLLQSWMRHSALRETSVPPGTAPRPAAIELGRQTQSRKELRHARRSDALHSRRCTAGTPVLQYVW
ncbi:hypothetical protein PCANC_20784 [Puccinia coronata f. sp. avenae]|uniref:Uncharacterized protein n=1 Tax=Puccinia coronata f. sp. avenae TaxID=200324 RepID=A0A2N5U886_9BASI|nr:hypothetical protein PCANC_20784 [Puccinia coronata f. sp. avenae]